MSFERFGEAAEEYARNADIVRAMEEAYQASLRRYWDAVRAELARRREEGQLSAPLRERAEWWDRAEGWYWWLSQDSSRSANRPCVWFRPYQPSLINEGRLTVAVGSPETRRDRQEAIRRIKDRPELQGCEREDGRRRWTIFRVTIPCPPEGPVLPAANVLSVLLEELWQLEQNWQLPYAGGSSPEAEATEAGEGPE